MTLANQCKHWLKDLFRYPAYRPADASYDEYWEHRDMGALNAFQKARADFLLRRVGEGDSILDIGCGDGRMLQYIKSRRPSLKVSGVDSSPKALDIARSRGLDVRKADLHDLGDASADHITFFEVLEHVPDSEQILAWATAHAKKSVVFSVPNTGFLFHRLRLLLGRSPLQWRAHPAEHLRFWTLNDMHWWMRSLGYRYEVHAYQGVPILNRLLPSLFAEGLLVTVKR